MTDEDRETDQVNAALVDQIRRRYEQDGLMLAGIKRDRRPEVLHRAATLAVEEMQAGPKPATWETARTRPYASDELDDPRDVLIGRLAAILGVVDGGYHPASYHAMLAAARHLQAELAAARATAARRQG